jgi:ribonuclease-3
MVLNFIYKKHWSKLSENNDFKSQLQELLHKQKKGNAQYKVLKSQGPAHDKNFTIGVFISNQEVSRGTGKNRKTAEQKAAKAALEYLKSVKA